MKCICLRKRTDGNSPCRCATPVEKCYVLGCYHPGVTPYPPDPTFGKACPPHAELWATTNAAEVKCNAAIRELERQLGWHA